MRITLDYYRILSVPIKATQEQIDKSFADRCQQQPRREYSEFAIASRQNLLQQAYQKLSDAEQRAAYDAKFFTAIEEGNGELKEIPESAIETTTEVTSPQVQLSTQPEETNVAITPSIEISPELFPGALLIYYELAEYELIVRLGVDYLNNKIYQESLIDEAGHVTDNTEENIAKNTGKEDVILSIVLSYLELSREQWRRKRYENAAISGQMGISLLEKEQLFPILQAEIVMDVHKLKPYRILELLAKSPINSPERLRGFQLLQEMIRQRGGIEGKGDDYSGLTVEEFLHFIQQLRNYLTVKEQQKLFVAEAKQDSGVAGFLAVYVLIARGYTHQQPQLILEAQNLLKLLSKNQDISWEQSICHLLLGQTEQAINTIKTSPESKIVTAIKEYSPDSPDLLAGICFYGKKWLKDDVVAQFWDLKELPTNLDSYFSNPKVQDYLENLAPVETLVENSSDKISTNINNIEEEQTKQRRNFFSWRKSKKSSEKFQMQASESSSPGSPISNTSSTITLERQPHQTKLEHKTHNNSAFRDSNLAKRNKIYNNQEQVQYTNQQSNSLPRRPKDRNQPRYKYKSPLWLIFLKGGTLLMALVLGLGALGFFITKQTLKKDTQKIAETTINSNTSELVTPKVTESIQTSITTPQAELEKPEIPAFKEESAQAVIQQWLDSKSAALGKSYQIDKLESILAADLLTNWSNTARYYQQTNVYRDYQHKLKITSVIFDPQKPNLATVEAEVQEIAQHYQAEKLNSSQSYNDNLLVRYQLIKQNDSWLIQTSKVLKTL